METEKDIKEQEKKIPTQGEKYTGYLWYSNEQKPRIYRNKELEQGIDLETPGIPFIIEGYLRSEKDSYSIKMTDGAYHIQHYHLSDYPFMKDKDGTVQTSDTCSVTAYLPNRFDKDIEKLLFARFWKKTPDNLCNGMDVLVPQDEIFIGFKLKNSNQL